jgi:hypothetical protein
MLTESAPSTFLPMRGLAAVCVAFGSIPPQVVTYNMRRSRFRVVADQFLLDQITRRALGLTRLEVASGRSLEQGAVGGKSRAVQRAIPGLLKIVEADDSAEVGTDRR